MNIHHGNIISIETIGYKWINLLIQAGISPKFLTPKHGPCPFCGGRDRFRFDNKNSSGSAFCNQCGGMSGFSFLARALGLNSKKDSMKVFEFINQNIGSTHHKTNLQIETPIKNQSKKIYEIIMKIWEGSISLDNINAEVGRKYFLNRGISNFSKIESLRFNQRCYYNNQHGCCIYYPALISKIENVDGKLIGIHRIFLTELGNKIPSEAKKSLGQISGGAVRIDKFFDSEIALCEGIETAFAVRELFNIPTWATLSTSGLKSIKLPKEIKKVIIYADKDKNFAGQIAAQSLQGKLQNLGIKSHIRYPITGIPSNSKGVDFLDELNLTFSHDKRVIK